MKIQEISLAAIVVTICMAFFVSVLLSAFKMPVAGELQGVINTSFTALVVVVPTWLAVQRTEKAKSEAFLSGMNAKAQEYNEAMLKYGGLKVGK